MRDRHPEWFQGDGDERGDGSGDGEWIPASVEIAQFSRWYGADLFWGWNRTVDDPGWRTRDGVVPYRVFRVMVDDLLHLLALERLNQSQAALHAQTVAWGEDEIAVRRGIRELTDEAIPVMDGPGGGEG